MNVAAAAPATGEVLTDWSWEPSVVGGIVLFTVVYYLLMGPWRERFRWGESPTRRQVTFFALSQLTLVVALLSPLDTIGDDYLFSAHMVQHLLLAAVWPPLLLLSFPGWFARLLFRGHGSWIMGFFTYPAAAIGLFNLDIYVWHLPPLYDLTLTNGGVHILEHLTFMFFGIFNWWPVLSPALGQRLSYPLQVLYLFLNMMLMMALGIVFTFAPSVLYPPYASAPRLWGMSAATDQEVGGLVMWYPGNLPYFLFLILAFYRWFDEGGPTATETQRITGESPTIGPPAL